MKQVSFKVAKALKEVGYPQDYKNAEDTYTNLNGGIWVKPTYLEVWLWLWRIKNIHIEIIDSKITTQCYATINGEKDTILYNSPEESIEKSIEYLIDNDLIK